MIEKQKLKPISGFPEWLPEVRMVEQAWIDRIRGVFESYGFAPIETRSVEPVEVLLKQGDTDKEIYALRRLMEEEASASEADYALHYDLTVPMARYVAANLNDLTFPFKRYQIQRAWRGERPQEGRFREFTQCDIDVVDTRDIPLHFDAEMPAIVYEVMQALDVGPTVTRINNRKVLEGFYRALGVEQPHEVIRIVDKQDKIGPDGVSKMLTDELSLDGATIGKVLDLARVTGTKADVVERVRALGITGDLLEQGLDELHFVMKALESYPEGAFVADLSVARGLAYYTGTVYEVKFADDPSFPTICGGGRYENLVGSMLNKHLPGIGISIGLTRIFSKLVREGRIAPTRKTPTQVMVCYLPDASYEAVNGVARTLRARGIKTELFHEPRKLKQQLAYASNKGIPHVWFPAVGAEGKHEVKTLATGAQADADPESWLPEG
ncbi:histidine--tRNA ligase [Marivibrio halodurans]|uniref:Histidine--tRNA ligase n=1 Tax=Marivibrio halodurans TaxID=2039722 RepID=A0A8J7S025_9PROT|nr:histidine--tRNA ligase [Marivibrio halodurans]MBP5857810.1 histidine--tRNA ligase [Marivibrio halodurans]